METPTYSVASLNAYIRSKFLQDPKLAYVKVKGELSNVKYHSSGHIYFTLKDNRSCIAGVMFSSSRANGLKFKLTEGQEVLVKGEVGVYERDGKYQIYASSITLDGEGELYERFEQLKKKLAEKGMFDEGYKQPIPKYINTLGVVSASTGAAVRDIINVSKRRFPYIQIILFPAKVQGEGASKSICDGIKVLEQYGVDTIIVGRGGGSIEDLWAFNEESVANAIFECRVPIISAVGHETDFTIADFVSDLRAPTPSAAAELAVFDYEVFNNKIRSYSDKMNRLMNISINSSKNRLEIINRRIMALSPTSKIREQKIRLDHIQDSLAKGIKKSITDNRYRLNVQIERLRGLDPLLKLSQGYSLVEDKSGKIVSSISSVKINDEIRLHICDGDIVATVTDTEGVDRNGR